MPALLIKLKEWKLTRSVGHYFGMVTPQPTYLKPDIFSNNFFDDDFKNILSLMNDDTWQEKEAKKYMNGIWKQISTATENIEEIENLKIFLNEIDRRRNTNWQELFPWLAEYKYVV